MYCGGEGGKNFNNKPVNSPHLNTQEPQLSQLLSRGGSHHCGHSRERQHLIYQSAQRTHTPFAPPPVSQFVPLCPKYRLQHLRWPRKDSAERFSLGSGSCVSLVTGFITASAPATAAPCLVLLSSTPHIPTTTTTALDVQSAATAMLPTGLWELGRRGVNREKRKRQTQGTLGPLHLIIIMLNLY